MHVHFLKQSQEWTVGKKNLSEDEFLEILQSFSDTGSDRNSDLSQDEYISEDESEHFSADKSSFFSKTGKKDFSSESKNEEIFLINRLSNDANSSSARNKKRKKTK